MKWILIILLFSLLFVFCIHTLTWITYDIGLHLTLGKIAVTEHHIVKTNFFSYTNPNFPWGNDYWIGKVLLYLGFIYTGLKGLIVFKAAIITATFILTFFAYFRKETLFFSIGVGLMSILMLIERTDIRPEIFSFLFLAWYLFVLFRKPNSKLLWLLPVVQLFWVNTHIYFFLGPFIYLLFLFGQYVNQKILPTKTQIYVGLLVLAVNVISPYGFGGALYPLNVLGNYGYKVGENLSPYSRIALGYPEITTWALTIGMIFGVISFLANYKNIKRNVFELGLFVITSTMAVVMLRNMPIFALCMLPISMKNIFEAKWFIRYSTSKAILSGTALIILIHSVINNSIYTTYTNAGIDRQFGLIIPSEGKDAIKFVKDHHIKGPVFNDYDTGNFLIWQLPDQKVFIDGRPEAYPADFIKNVYIAMQNNPVIFEKYSEQYGFNYIFWSKYDATPPSRKFIKALGQNPKWKLVYKDDAFGIFIRNTPENQKLTGG